MILKISNREVLIDDEDYSKIKDNAWYLSLRNFVCSHKFKNGKRITKRLHREILSLPTFRENKIEVDHINGNRLDNRKLNLRICNHSENNCNKGIRSDNTSGYKGVSKLGDKWTVNIQKNGVCYYGGLFKTKKNAAKWYNKKALELHGDFAYQNPV